MSASAGRDDKAERQAERQRKLREERAVWLKMEAARRARALERKRGWDRRNAK